MNVSFTKPQTQLSPYIDTFWVFESGSGVPMTDGRTIVPDGRAKIIIPYKNPLSVIADNGSIYTGEHQIFLCGIQNNPRTICSPTTDTASVCSFPANPFTLKFEDGFGLEGADHIT